MTNLAQVFAPSSKRTMQGLGRLHLARQSWAAELISIGYCVDHRYKWIQEKSCQIKEEQSSKHSDAVSTSRNP